MMDAVRNEPLIQSLMRAGATKKIDAHSFEREANEHYVEPRWTDRVLFEGERFNGFIHDPCCGWGRIPWAAREAGYIGVTGSDIVDRSFEGVGIENFLETTEPRDNIVMNPPFNLQEEFIRHACSVSRYKVASIMLSRRLAAAHWMRELPLVQVWYLTPRPSMPTGTVVEEIMISLGKDPSGGTQDFVWVVFDIASAYMFPPKFGWLHRDRGAI